jgi:hypothetical protein
MAEKNVLKDLKALHKGLKENGGGPTQSITVTEFDPNRWEDLVTAIVAKYPTLQVNAAPIMKQGSDALGRPVVLAALKGAEGSVTLYSKGKAVWTKLSPVTPRRRQVPQAEGPAFVPEPEPATA